MQQHHQTPHLWKQVKTILLELSIRMELKSHQMNLMTLINFELIN
jgi:hypothetical protein